MFATAGPRGDRKSTRLNSSHVDLPSFPTRRSPDLSRKQSEFNSQAASSSRALAAIVKPQQNVRDSRPAGRSEEHTSELQSRRSPLFPYTTLSRSEPETKRVQFPGRQQQQGAGGDREAPAECSRQQARG